jgi:hypothetical protein
MLFKGVFQAQASGSVGGLTASHGRSGSYFRQRSIPVNPNTSFQQAMRNITGNLATAWVTTLTDVQRAAWDAYGDAVAMTNRVGDTIYLTGLNHFIRSNAPRIQASEPRVDDAPTIFALTDVTLPSMTISEGTQLVSVAYDNTDAWANEVGGFLKFDLSRPNNPTINYFKGPYRFTDKEIGLAVPPTSPKTATVPFPVVEGQNVFALLRGALVDGRLSQAIRIGTTVAA